MYKSNKNKTKILLLMSLFWSKGFLALLLEAKPQATKPAEALEIQTVELAKIAPERQEAEIAKLKAEIIAAKEKYNKVLEANIDELTESIEEGIRERIKESYIEKLARVIAKAKEEIASLKLKLHEIAEALETQIDASIEVTEALEIQTATKPAEVTEAQTDASIEVTEVTEAQTIYRYEYKKEKEEFNTKLPNETSITEFPNETSITDIKNTKTKPIASTPIIEEKLFFSSIFTIFYNSFFKFFSRIFKTLKHFFD